MDTPQWGIILRSWPDVPVFHAFGDIRRDETGLREFTRCGREVGLATPWLPYKHVVKFGRPCKGCFPA